MPNREPSPRGYLRWSYGLLLLALIIAFLTGVVLDAALAPLSLTLQRGLVLTALVFPATLGAVMGALALRQMTTRRWLAVASLFLNGLVALFYLALLAIAG